MVAVKIPDHIFEQAIKEGDARQDFAVSKDLKNYGATILTPDEERLNHHIGRIGELVLADHFGLKSDATIGIIDAVDVTVLEARARRNIPGRTDLAIRPHDKMMLPHVLVLIDLETRWADIVGWLLAIEAKQRALAAKTWWCESKGVWYVPPPYHSIKSLEDWIWVGAPRHTGFYDAVTNAFCKPVDKED